MNEKIRLQKFPGQFPESALRSTLPRLAEDVSMSPLRRTPQNARDSAVRSAHFDVYGQVAVSTSTITRSGVPQVSSACSSDSEAVPGFPLGPPRGRLMKTNSEYAMRRGRKLAPEGNYVASSMSTSPNPSDDDVPGEATTVDACAGTSLSDANPGPLQHRHALIGEELSWLQKRYQGDNCTSIVPTFDEVLRWLTRMYAPFRDPTTIPSRPEMDVWLEVQWKKHKSLGGRSMKKK